MEQADVHAIASRYLDMIEGLSPSAERLRADIEFARGQAMAYLWGRLDAGDSAVSGYAGDAFPYAYASMMAAGKMHAKSTLAIRDAWDSFRQHGEIRDHNGRAIDPVSESNHKARP